MRERSEITARAQASFFWNKRVDTSIQKLHPASSLAPLRLARGRQHSGSTHMTIPLYSYDLAYQGFIPERTALRMERDGQAKLVRHRKGRIARVIRYKRARLPWQRP